MDAWPASAKIVTETITPVVSTFVDRTQSGFRSARSGERHFWQMRILTKLVSRENKTGVMGWQSLVAFLDKQRGRFNPFTFISTTQTHPLGAITGTPAVLGATLTGARQVVVDGWGASLTQLKSGDFFKFANHLKVYRAVLDCVSDGAGQSTLTFEPALVADVADNELLTVDSVPFTMALSVDSYDCAISVEGWTQFDLSLEEVWNV